MSIQFIFGRNCCVIRKKREGVHSVLAAGQQITYTTSLPLAMQCQVNCDKDRQRETKTNNEAWTVANNPLRSINNSVGTITRQFICSFPFNVAHFAAQPNRIGHWSPAHVWTCEEAVVRTRWHILWLRSAQKVWKAAAAGVRLFWLDAVAYLARISSAFRPLAHPSVCPLCAHFKSGFRNWKWEVASWRLFQLQMCDKCGWPYSKGHGKWWEECALSEWQWLAVKPTWIRAT